MRLIRRYGYVFVQSMYFVFRILRTCGIIRNQVRLGNHYGFGIGFRLGFRFGIGINRADFREYVFINGLFVRNGKHNRARFANFKPVRRRCHFIPVRRNYFHGSPRFKQTVRKFVGKRRIFQTHVRESIRCERFFLIIRILLRGRAVNEHIIQQLDKLRIRRCGFFRFAQLYVGIFQNTVFSNVAIIIFAVYVGVSAHINNVRHFLCGEFRITERRIRLFSVDRFARLRIDQRRLRTVGIFFLRSVPNQHAEFFCGFSIYVGC